MILAATGHRPDKLGGYNQETDSLLLRLALRRLKLYRPDRVISGMALGWDIAVAQAAVALGIPLTAAVPFLDQDRLWREEDQNRYRRLCRQADYVCIDPHYSHELGYRELIAAFHARNHWMVDHGDEILALWNGDGRGGTWHCIEYAIRRRRPIHHCWFAWEKMLKERPA